MKRSGSIIFSLLILFIFFHVPAFGQSTNKNYIEQTDLLVERTDPDSIGLLTDGQKMKLIQYFDGLGRLIQTNNYHQSPTYKDIVQHIEYNEAGRQKFSYLPFSYSAQGAYLPDARIPTLQFYTNPLPDPTIPATTTPFGETRFDDSPLNRVMEQGFPGESWQLGAHPQQFSYLTNAANDIRRFQYNETMKCYYTTGWYDAQSLFVTEALDENQNPTRTYKDKLGRMIVEESELEGVKIRTYYIYDLYGNLALVISPEGSRLITGDFYCTDDFVKKWCYAYTYDPKQRLIEKRIPGMTAPICYIYDRLNRVILSQDGNLKQSNKWLFTKYDVYGRPVMEGKYWNNQFTSRSAMQDYVVATENSYSLYESRSPEYYTLFFGYTMLAFPPATGSEILKVYYYDNYDFDSNGSDEYSYRPVAGFGDLQPAREVRGMATGTRIKILGTQTTGVFWLISVSFYDNRLRLIQQQSSNYLAGYDTITTRYNFVGDAILQKHSHSGTNIDNQAISLKILRDSLVYDHARRLKESWQKVNSQSYIRMTQLNYNELGQLTEKNLYNASGLVQSLDYRYNIRGWIKGINIMNSGGNDSGDKFFEELLYDGYVNLTGHQSQYNGNISAIRWKSPGMTSWRGYACFYDGMNRLSQAAFATPNNWYWTGPNTYSVPLVQYDRNGNISRLKRMGTCSGQTMMIDDLTYYYDGSNLLYGVSDAASANCGFKDGSGMPEYSYDANGNMKYDRNKGIIDITYNHLNLPDTIKFENNRRIEYLYDANGIRLQKRYFNQQGLLTTTTDYSGEFVYTNKSIDYILINEGRLKKAANGMYSPEFFLRDHLGNVRVVLISAGSPLQATDYYPFGMEIPLFSTSNNQLKYNSRELQTDADLQWYFYGARYYDAQIGRFHTLDLLAEKNHFRSPYSYAANNPVLFMDWMGLEPTWNVFTSSYFDDLNNNGVQDRGERNWDLADVVDIQDNAFKPPLPYIVSSDSQSNNSNASESEDDPPKKSEKSAAGGGGGILDDIQTGLDVLGLIPGVGEFFDGANALIYTVRSDYVNAGLSAAACIPFAGWAATGGKLANKAYTVYQGVDKATGAVKYVGITSREVTQRAAEHMAKGDAWKALDYRAVPGALNLDRTGARVIEQNLINQYGLPNLYNQINSISPQYWPIYGIK